MGWSIGWQGAGDSAFTDEYLLSLGKALFLASEFEKKCQYVLRIGKLVRYVQENEDRALLFQYTETLRDPMLGPTLESLGILSESLRGELETLNRHAKRETTSRTTQAYSMDARS